MLRNFLNLLFDIDESPGVIDGEIIAVSSTPLQIQRVDDNFGPRPELDWMMGVD